ncbi:MAG: glycoside hydrolase family 1 protein [Firmicutes bacterium]|nr:glycoside hydrolase family 1 protein [Bacillota bacterium]
MKGFSFPEGFLWGAATAGHQIEGNNTASDWWAWEPGKIQDGSTSGLACDSWNRWEEDFDLMRSMGLNAYRMGIEWSRVEPRPGEWDDAAFDRYEQMMKGLESRGIAVCLTLYHWVLPKWVADMGGWENPATVDRFAAFCGQVVARLGQYPALWCTLNEPMVYVLFSYITGHFPPEKRSLRAARIVLRHLLLGHVEAFNIIRSESPPGQDAMIGVAHNMAYFKPARRNLLDLLVAGFQRRALNATIIEALATGVAPGPVGNGVAVPGLARAFTYMGVNYYFSRTVAFRLNGLANGFSAEVIPADAVRTDFGWPICPEGFFHVLSDVKSLGVPVYILENGISDRADALRPKYIVDHLREVRRAIDSGVDVRGYFHWTLADNFEWRAGYSQKFGLYAIDRADPALARIPRQSAEIYGKIARANGVTDEIASYVQGYAGCNDEDET